MEDYKKFYITRHPNQMHHILISIFNLFHVNFLPPIIVTPLHVYVFEDAPVTVQVDSSLVSNG